MEFLETWENLFSTQIKLIFYKKKPKNWSFWLDQGIWEVWDLNLDIVRTVDNEDFIRMREYVGEKLGEELLSVCETINKPVYTYMPIMPTHHFDNNFYDTFHTVYENKFSDCSPYLYRIEFGQGNNY